MTKRETSLLFILINTVILSFGFISANICRDTIKTIRSRIERLEKNISELKQKRESLKSTSSETSNQNKIQNKEIEEILSAVISKFSTYNIKINQYQISKNEKINYADISLSASPSNLLKLIYSLNEEKYSFSIETINIKEDKNEIKCNLRISDIPCIIKHSAGSKKNSYQSEKLFNKPVSIITPAQNKITPKEETIKKDNGSYIIIGKSSDAQNLQTIFIKNKTTGKISVISSKDILSETNNAYIINLNNEKQEILK